MYPFNNAKSLKFYAIDNSSLDRSLISNDIVEFYIKPEDIKEWSVWEKQETAKKMIFAAF